MNSGHQPPARRGFTLIELMVAMAITTIMVTILVTITSLALDTWNRSRAEVRAARQAKAMVEIMARDFEAMVTRSGNDYQWLVAETGAGVGSGSNQSPNSADLIFFSAATDRYNGAVGTADDAGGDISAVGYSLRYKDPIQSSGADFPTFVLYRNLVDPDDAFRDLIGSDDLKTAFTPYQADLDGMDNFVCENIYQFSMTFHVETSVITNGVTTSRLVPVTLGEGSASMITVRGGNLEVTPPVATLQPGSRIAAVEVSLTVLSDNAVNTLRTGANVPANFISQNSFQYSKRIEVPRP